MFKKYFLIGTIGGLTLSIAATGLIFLKIQNDTDKPAVTAASVLEKDSNTDELLAEIKNLKAKLGSVTSNVSALKNQMNAQQKSATQHSESATQIRSEQSSTPDRSDQNLSNDSEAIVSLSVDDYANDELTPPEFTDEELRQQEDQQWQERLNALSMNLAAQATDEIWNQEVNEQFQSVLSKHTDKVILDELSCGETVCQLRSHVPLNEHGRPRGELRMDHIVHGEIGWNGQMVSQYNVETGEFTAFLFKEGADLSMLTN